MALALNITGLKEETKFQAGKILKANGLNEAFEQPIKLTNALSLALASFALTDSTVDIRTISQNELTSLYKGAFNDILRYKAPGTSNIAGITFEKDANNNPILKMSSSNATQNTTFEMTPSVIKIYSTSGSTTPIEINPTDGKITASVFEGVASKVKLTASSSSSYFNVWFGKDNVLYGSDKVQFNPSTGTLKITGSIDFGGGTIMSASGFAGASAYAEKLQVIPSPSTNVDYHVLFASKDGTTYYSDDLTYNPVDKVLSASYFSGIATKTDLLKTSQIPDSNAQYYFTLLKTEPTDGHEYQEVYYNPYVYIEGNAIYARDGFKGTASSALRASSIDVTEEKDSAMYYVPFATMQVGSGYDGTLKYNSNFKYNPATNTLYANITGSSTSATKFSTTKDINISGMLTGTTSTDFSSTTNLEISYSANYGLYSELVLKPNTASGVINVGNSSCKFIAIISIYNGGLGGQTLTFNYSNKSQDYTSIFAYSSGDFFMLRKVSSSESKWYLVYGSSESAVRNSTTPCTPDCIGSVVVYRYE